MTERYPDDAALLALGADAETGVEYIPTGLSPYYLEFRKLIHRLLLSAHRANDLRVFQEDDLTVGVRGGRCVIGDTAITFEGSTGLTVENNATTSIWLDDAGTVQTSTAGLPDDRTTFIPLAEVIAEAGAITTLVDRRGEAFLRAVDLVSLGVNASAGEINQAMMGIHATVNSAALNTLTGGGVADTEHRHESISTDEDAETSFRLTNVNTGASANVALAFDLPMLLPYSTVLAPDVSTGWLQQRFGSQTYALLGATSLQYAHEGDLNATQTDKLMGTVPIDGTISDVILTIGSNIESDTASDGLSATVRVNGAVVTSTPPAITNATGTGFRSTAQGDGTAAVVVSDGTEQVSKGDVLTVDLTRNVTGTVSNEASNIVVQVVVRGSQPE